MLYVALTVDQRHSRRSPDRVTPMLAELDDVPATLAFTRTAGDEFQGLLNDPEAVIATLALLLPAAEWTIGIGVGAVEEPLPADTREARGEAYLHARSAQTQARSRPARVQVVGADQYRAEQATTVLTLWADVLRRRSERGWEVAAALAGGATHEQAAAQLKISQSAVSQRVRAAGLEEDRMARRLATQLIGEMMEEVDRWPSS